MHNASSAIRRNSRQARSRRGATLVEAALVIGLMFMFMLAIFEYGRFVMVRQIMANAAREGARLAIVSTDDKTVADIEDRVNNLMLDGRLFQTNIAVYKADPITGANIGAWTDAALGECIAVEVTAEYRALIPRMGFVRDRQPLVSKSMMRSEAN